MDENGYPISGEFALHTDDGNTMKYWLGFDDLSDRFGIFGLGADGSLYAFWIDDNENQKIVHLGSEGDGLYILAENFIDFLRLLAIGYDEIGFADMNMTVQAWNKGIEKDENEGINPSFRKWVSSEFGVNIPNKGKEIADFNDESFNHWIQEKLRTIKTS